LLVPLAALAIPGLLLMAAGHGWLLLAAASAFVFVNFTAQPSAVALISDYAAERLQGRVYGWTNLTGFGVGSFAGIVGGVIAERHGVEWVFVLLAGAAAVIAVTAIVLNVWLRFSADASR
jgi:MFS family permease